MIDEQEVAQESAEQETVQEQPVTEPTQQQQVQSAKDKETNLRILREAAERALRERDAAIEQLQQFKKPQQQEPVNEDLPISSDDLVEGKHLAPYAQRIKQLEKQQKEQLEQTMTATAELKLRTQYSDFDKVVTMENIQQLSASFPELAKTINSHKDLYEKAASAYTLIKKFGIYSEEPFNADKQKAIENSNKPRPLTSISPQQGESPLSRVNAFANGLTDDLKKQLLKEMEEARKGY